ncbi:MAG: hypothetical protein Q8M74_00250 [Chloroflexota bacterium]|nr:hypothetical protein [Chloroflexota bacterium]
MAVPVGKAALAFALVVGTAMGVLGCDAAAPAAPTAATPSPEAPARFAIRLDGIDVDSGTLRYMNVQIFFDEEADRAAKEDGHPGGAPNPIWIRELATTGALPIAPDARVTMSGHDSEGNRVMKRTSVTTFVRVFTVGEAGTEWTSAPWLFVDVVDGRVVSIEQVETP